VSSAWGAIRPWTGHHDCGLSDARPEARVSDFRVIRSKSVGHEFAQASDTGFTIQLLVSD
jgi:hypothetical protein